jgi:hypothetical protein
MEMLYLTFITLFLNILFVLIGFMLWNLFWISEYGCSIPNTKIDKYQTYFSSKNFDIVIKELFGIFNAFDKEYLVSSIGFEAYSYLLFQREAITFLLVACLISIANSAISTIYNSESKTSTYKFMNKLLFDNKAYDDFTDMNNLVSMILIILFFVRFYYVLKSKLRNLYFSRFDKLSREKNYEWLQCRTLHISGISPTERQMNKLKAKLNLFLANHKNNNFGHVIEISFIPDYKVLTDLEIEKEEINDLKKLIPFNKVNTCRYCCLSKTFRSENNIKNRLSEIDNEIDYQLTKPTYSSGHAFVTFNSLKSAYLCLQEFKESTYKKLKIKFDEIKNHNIQLFNKSNNTHRTLSEEIIISDGTDEINVNSSTDDFIVDQMIEPMDIIWTNIGGDRGVNIFRIIFCTLIIFSILLFLTTPTVMYSMIKSVINYEDESKEESTLEKVFNVYLPPLAILALNQLILIIIDYIGYFEKHYTHSRMQSSIFKYNFFYLILNMLIFPGIVMTTASSLYGLIFKHKAFSLKYLYSSISNIYMSDNSYFFVNLILQTATFSCIFYLLRLDEIFLNGFSAFVSFYKRHFVNNGKQWHRKEQDIFQFGYFYAQMLTMLSISIVFSLIAPFILIAAILFFLLRHYIDFISLLVVHRQEIDSNGDLVSLPFYYKKKYIMLYCLCINTFLD